MSLGRVAGSMKKKVVASELQEERAKCAFDQKEMGLFLGGGQAEFDYTMKYLLLMDKHPELANHFKFYDMTVS